MFDDTPTRGEAASDEDLTVYGPPSGKAGEDPWAAKPMTRADYLYKAASLKLMRRRGMIDLETFTTRLSLLSHEFAGVDPSDFEEHVDQALELVR